MKAQDATVEQLIADITHWEDPDSNLVVNHGWENPYTKEGLSISISDMEGRIWGEGPTFKEALIDFQTKIFARFSWPLDEIKEYKDLDWSDYVGEYEKR